MSKLHLVSATIGHQSLPCCVRLYCTSWAYGHFNILRFIDSSSQVLIMTLCIIYTVEPQGVQVIHNGTFQSELCEPLLVTSQAPYFTCTFNNDVTVEFNGADINGHYNANVSRSYSPKGHRQASLMILGANSTMNNALITCWGNATSIILQYRLTIIGNFQTT